MKELEEELIKRQTYVHVWARFTLGGSTGSSSISTKKEVEIISKFGLLVTCIIGCNIALKMALSSSKATMCQFSFWQAMIEALVKRNMSKSQHTKFGEFYIVQNWKPTYEWTRVRMSHKLKMSSHRVPQHLFGYILVGHHGYPSPQKCYHNHFIYILARHLYAPPSVVHTSLCIPHLGTWIYIRVYIEVPKFYYLQQWIRSVLATLPFLKYYLKKDKPDISTTWP